MGGIIGGSICVIGIVCNIGSLIVFRHGVIKTSTTYLLQWLAFVDTILLVLYVVQVTLNYMGDYLSIDYIQVYIWPVWRIARSSTNWLTVFIAVDRYVAVCKPVSNLYSHFERHRRKYVRIVLTMAVLCNIPYFFEHHLSQDDENNGKSDLFKLVYHNIMYLAFTVCLPVIILLIVTIKLQNSNMSNLSINTVLITILRIFIICQFPLLVYKILNFIYDRADIKIRVCGRFDFYFSGVVLVLLILNSAARPFIYMVLNDLFVWPLRHTLRNERAETIEMGSI